MTRLPATLACLLLLLLSALPVASANTESAMYRSAMDAYVAKKFDSAKSICMLILKDDANDYDAYKLLSDIAEKEKNKTGQFEYLLKAYRILESDPSPNDREIALKAEFDAQLDKLDGSWSKWKDNRSKFIAALLAAARQQADAGNKDNAMLSVTMALGIDPRNFDAKSLKNELEGKAAPKQPREQTVLFTGKDLSGWQKINGSWEARDGAIASKEDLAVSAPYYLQCDKTVPAEFDFNVEFLLSSGTRWGSEAMISLRTQSDAQYEFTLTVSKSNVSLNATPRAASGEQVVPTSLGLALFDEPLELDAWHRLGFKLKANILTINVDGVDKLSYKLGDDPKLGRLEILLGLGKGACKFKSLTLNPAK